MKFQIKMFQSTQLSIINLDSELRVCVCQVGHCARLEGAELSRTAAAFR